MFWPKCPLNWEFKICSRLLGQKHHKQGPKRWCVRQYYLIAKLLIGLEWIFLFFFFLNVCFFWGGEVGAYKVQAYPRGVRATRRDESKSVPSPENPFKKRDLELPSFQGSLPSCSPHSVGYTRTSLHLYFPVANFCLPCWLSLSPKFFVRFGRNRCFLCIFWPFAVGCASFCGHGGKRGRRCRFDPLKCRSFGT